MGLVQKTMSYKLMCETKHATAKMTKIKRKDGYQEGLKNFVAPQEYHQKKLWWVGFPTGATHRKINS